MSPPALTRALARPTLLYPIAFRASTTTTPLATRCFSQSEKVSSGAAGHGDRYDPPSGNLFGVKPGEKYEKEGWETLWYWGFFGSIGLATVAYAFKPDTSIQTWALEEARRRLEAEGILPDPDKQTKK